MHFISTFCSFVRYVSILWYSLLFHKATWEYSNYCSIPNFALHPSKPPVLLIKVTHSTSQQLSSIRMWARNLQFIWPQNIKGKIWFGPFKWPYLGTHVGGRPPEPPEKDRRWFPLFHPLSASFLKETTLLGCSTVQKFSEKWSEQAPVTTWQVGKKNLLGTQPIFFTV